MDAGKAFPRKMGRVMLSINWTRWITCIALGITALPAQGVILYRSATRNTAVPSGTFQNSGWQYQMTIGSFLGTPIGPHAFVMAKHVAASTGNTFSWNNTTYTVTGGFDVPGTDLSVRTVNNTFASFAPVYDPAIDGALTGRTLVVFGKGTQRGAEVNLATAPNTSEGTLRGWQWGPGDGVQSWGTNSVAGFAADNSGDSLEYLAFSFSRNGTSEEATVSPGDSSGGVFVKSNDGVWKLAAVNSLVDSTFGLTPPGNQLSAAIFDKGNLYQDLGGTTTFYEDTAADQPAYAYSTNVTRYLGSLAPYIPVPGDATLDGKVNTVDFNLLAGHFGQSSWNWADGDFNHDGVVNSSDFSMLVSKYGHSGTPPAGAIVSGDATAATGIVPEPAGALVLLGLTTLAGLRRRFSF